MVIIARLQSIWSKTATQSAGDRTESNAQPLFQLYEIGRNPFSLFRNVNRIGQNPNHILAGDFQPDLDSIISRLGNRDFQVPAGSLEDHLAVPKKFPFAGQWRLSLNFQLLGQHDPAAHLISMRVGNGEKVEARRISKPIEGDKNP